LEFTTTIQAVDPSEMQLISEIFIPNFHYGFFKESLRIDISDGSYFYNSQKQTLYYKYDPRYMGMIVGDEILHTLRVHVPELVVTSWGSWEILGCLFAVFLGLYFAF
jgi:hypothetical protein